MFFGDETIQFMCDERKIDVIPHPYPSRKYIPEWYKKLANYSTDGNDMEMPTLKRCPPFLDAMSVGWIIPFAADTTFSVIDDGEGIKWKTDFFETMIEHHNPKQISTHPKTPLIPLKIINHWMVKTPPGWSCIFTPALNRPDDFFDLMSGIVETDKFWEYVNFPGFLRAKSGTFTVKKGHPLMQVIPFKRSFKKEANIRTLNKKDIEAIRKHRDKHSAHFSQYRDTMWEKK
jgi:hypothetical protein